MNSQRTTKGSTIIAEKAHDDDDGDGDGDGDDDDNDDDDDAL